jgi:3-isopropylmalate/(R)-2-methylmalate dehydratase large subunit
VAHVLATQTIWQKKPAALRITVTGRLGPGVGAKDLALAGSRNWGPTAHAAMPSNMPGPAVETLSMEARMTLCNFRSRPAAASAWSHPTKRPSFI